MHVRRSERAFEKSSVRLRWWWCVARSVLKRRLKYLPFFEFFFGQKKQKDVFRTNRMRFFPTDIQSAPGGETPPNASSRARETPRDDNDTSLNRDIRPKRWRRRRIVGARKERKQPPLLPYLFFTLINSKKGGEESLWKKRSKISKKYKVERCRKDS